MTELATLLVSDGKPGHFRLAEGILAAIARRRAIGITRIDIHRPWWMPARALSTLTNGPTAGRNVVPASLGFAPKPVPRCDLVVSAGGDTLAANVWLARHYGCANVFYGSLRRYRPADFSLVLTSYQANAIKPNHAMTLKPSAFDPDALSPRERSVGGPLTTGLLIGGDSGTVRFQDADWAQLMALLMAETNGGRWIVSNSRRTPIAISDMIAKQAKAAPEKVQFIDVRADGAMGLAALFEACDQIAVTVDSSSMVSEAIWARKPVVALLPRACHLPKLEQDYRAYLATQRWIGSLPLENATPRALADAMGSLAVLETNPLDRLADLIQARLPKLFVR